MPILSQRASLALEFILFNLVAIAAWLRAVRHLYVGLKTLAKETLMTLVHAITRLVTHAALRVPGGKRSHASVGTNVKG